MFTVEMNITRKEWLKQPALRWNEGLNRAGINFRQMMQRTHYPPIPAGSRYERTYKTADEANFNITIMGQEMEFGSTVYSPFLFIPARTVQNWQEHKDETIENMKLGFASGIAAYEGS